MIRYRQLDRNLATIRLQKQVGHIHNVVLSSMSKTLWRQVVVFDAQNNSARAALFDLRSKIHTFRDNINKKFDEQ